MSRLSNIRILAALEAGTIKIEPFHTEQLNNVSYDLSLGRWAARFKEESGRYRPRIRNLALDDPRDRFFMEFHSSNKEERDVAEALWRSEDTSGIQVGFLPDNTIRWAPKEIMLTRTREICGGNTTITTDIGAPSTVGRHAITACRCAGIGDVGYDQHPWTLEQQNDSCDEVILPVGAIVAQATFSDVGPILPGTSYEVRGNYGAVRPWHPMMMIPKRIKVAKW